MVGADYNLRMQGFGKMASYFDAVITEHMRNPKENLISELLTAEIESGRPSRYLGSARDSTDRHRGSPEVSLGDSLAAEGGQAGRAILGSRSKGGRFAPRMRRDESKSPTLRPSSFVFSFSHYPVRLVG